ncbi:Crp/Fnr family transcriptional regulator [Flagellimonas zhangzhouensis]|uniref:cAMP-binding domain of CRP or a regulatory subunit of cAMP-dependent protein kinases n=1 Tax=Flagellimonas zhangzhouensis TaxID=1073328 RepID=A0A1H2U5I0_9FLAO|nr:Crp/Fnr family transcriptional regulator [Allomuricauda zhangzhouensis]SDQ20060.1 cAMP-binding domain of CRP or a regulatory subunit of cAMP-dependent protein kinases [Allomuricauda zhangzhouensis]SDW51436.1 cAMP-binding domain of CRP or a regulatory subunit of cAMP-dependent protein kinases [Allomuricauda zhangzhouensis]
MIKELYKRIDDENLWEKNFTIERNEYLKVAGTTDTNLYFIESGSLKISIINEYEEHIIRFGYQGNFIISLDSFFTEKSSDLYIQSIKKTALKSVSKTRFMEFVRSNPENVSLWETIMEQLVLQQFEREKDILISSPKERFERVLARSPQLFQEIPNKYIATYLRMTPETLSRLKKS